MNIKAVKICRNTEHIKQILKKFNFQAVATIQNLWVNCIRPNTQSATNR